MPTLPVALPLFWLGAGGWQPVASV